MKPESPPRQIHASIPAAAHAELTWLARAFHGGSMSAAVAEAGQRLLRITFAERDISDPVYQARERVRALAPTPEQVQDLIGAAATRMVHSEQACADEEADRLVNAHLLPLERAVLWTGAKRLATLIVAGRLYMDEMTISDLLAVTV